MNSKMKAILLLPLSRTFRYWYSPSELHEFDTSSGKFAGYSSLKLRIDCRANLKFEDENLRNETGVEEQIVHDDEYETEEKEGEFSFHCTNPNASPVRAEDVFENGQIRPTLPILDCMNRNAWPLRPPLKKHFLQKPRIFTSSAPPASKLDQLDGELERPCCYFPGIIGEETSSERWKNSKFTRFSKTWRFRDLFRRSNRDEQKALISSNSSSKSNSSRKNHKVKGEKTSSDGGKNVGKKVKASKGAKAKAKVASSFLEKYYVVNGLTVVESDKRRSHLPYNTGSSLT